jgi:signal transduction histidine kinase
MHHPKLRRPRHVVVLFIAVSVVSVAALIWLSWRLLEQDKDLENQRIQERLERAADLIVSSFDLGLSEIENRLETLPDPGANALSVAFGPLKVETRPAGRLLYDPFTPPVRESPVAAFDAGEALEFRQQDHAGAAAAFRALARSNDPLVRAGALLRLGRNLRKNNQIREALAVYAELAKLGSTPVGGDPAELLAREARCALLKELDQRSELEREAGSLNTDLQAGRWRLNRVSFQFHSQEIDRWLTVDPVTLAERQSALALAAATESLWEQWQELRQAKKSGRGRRSVWGHGRSVLLVWDGTPDRLSGLVAGPDYLESRWSRSWRDLGVKVALLDSDSHSVLQPIPPSGPQQALRASSDTRLPWTLRIASADPAADLAQRAGRRRLLLAGLAMMAVMLIVGGYFTTRAVSRELAVSRLQSDFVSAVSHEFRTPLTSMLHLTDSLDRGIVSDEDRRRQYYSALAHETTRLHRLVESLLNFGRMEAGAFEYRFEPVDLAALAGDVVAEFRKELASSGHRVELRADDGLLPLRVDREALGRALWNLLDNAVKYSPGRPAIWVDLARDGKHVSIRVRDQGPGIPVEEQKDIFKKFVRGSAARASNVKGTGIGLAMVRHTVRAHGGEVRVESRPGEGSTFTILLPEKG